MESRVAPFDPFEEGSVHFRAKLGAFPSIPILASAAVCNKTRWSSAQRHANVNQSRWCTSAPGIVSPTVSMSPRRRRNLSVPASTRIPIAAHSPRSALPESWATAQYPFDEQVVDIDADIIVFEGQFRWPLDLESELLFRVVQGDGCLGAGEAIEKQRPAFPKEGVPVRDDVSTGQETKVPAYRSSHARRSSKRRGKRRLR